MTTFPMLFKLNSNGKLMQWEVLVERAGSLDTSEKELRIGEAGIIVTRYGQVDGSIQVTRDVVDKGKNLGRKNETTALQQAEAEAKSKWEIQQRINGYVQEKSRALAGENDRGGWEPMLAKKFHESKKKITWPAAIQPKLDGIRCPSVVGDDDAYLFSRNGKPLTAVPHIQAELALAFPSGSRPDGELYNHDLKEDFEGLISIVRKAKAIDTGKVMQYHIYDVAGTGKPFQARSAWLREVLCNEDGSPKFQYLRFVETRVVQDEDEAYDAYSDFKGDGYEGAMVRNLDSMYEEDTRSFHLQKVKVDQDQLDSLPLEQEFPIVGILEGRGKLRGHVGSFWCNAGGKNFKVKLKGTLPRLKELFENPGLWEGKPMTVMFQNWTKEGKPRFPVGKAIRDYE